MDLNRNRQTDFLQVCACCCYYETFGKDIIQTFESRSKLQQQREPNITLLNKFSHSLFSSWPVVITIIMENVFLFVLSLLKSCLLSVFLLWTGKYHACFLKKTNVNNVYFSTKKNIKSTH